MADLADQQVVDAGLDQTIKQLTPERITKVINSVLSQAVAGRLKLYLKTCVHCGLCAEACHTYLSRDRDPLFSPVGKVKNTLWKLVKKKGRFTSRR